MMCLKWMILASFFGSFVAAPALAENLCTERGTLVETLKKRYAELPVSKGLSGSGHVLEVYVSEAGSWTILVTRPTGESCILSAGENWHQVPVASLIEQGA